MDTASFRAAEKIPVVVVLDNVRSRMNVGSVFRTADAFRLAEVVLVGITDQPPHPEIHKTALGATESVAWVHFSQGADALGYLREKGYAIWVVEQTDRSVPLDELQLEPGHPVAVVLGNEVYGVQPPWLEGCQGALEIPQHGTKHSLNVAVAAGIVLYSLSRPYLGFRPPGGQPPV